MIRLVFALILTSCVPAFSQTGEPNALNATPAVPTVTFTLNWDKGSPNWYSVAIQSVGLASYRSTPGERDGGSDADVYSVQFTASKETLEKIFELAKDANYFQGEFDYKKGRIAHTGDKTLVYQDGPKRIETTFNWSQNQSVQRLADYFQGISITMEFGRRLDHLYRFEKLGLDRDLKRMEELKRSNQLPEVQALQPVLKKIANDRSVVNVARQRALRLMGESDAPARSVVNGR